MLRCIADVGLNGGGMKISIGTALLAATLMLGVPASIVPAAAAEATAAKKVQGANAGDVSTRRYHRHARYAWRPDYPYPMYFRRPVYYAPAPFLPIPPLWGYGWERW
jgi:hypothetical protein